MFGLLLFSGCPIAARGSYFPDPTPTAQWDVIWGQIYGFPGAVPVGTEVAAWDQSGTIRFRATVSSPGDIFGTAAFFGPPAGSAPSDFTWRIFDGMTEWLASVRVEGTTWPGYEGSMNTFRLNLDRDQPQRVIPEPATMLALGALGLTGIAAGLKKRGIL